MIVSDVTCPLCGSGEVRGFKNLRDNGQWEHQCISGIEHGYYTVEGEQHMLPEKPWFMCDGRVFTEHGLVGLREV